MRKVNRLIFKVVAVLLTFVLVTTCVVSGTLAKYTVSKDRSVNVKLEKFGVVVDTVVDKEALEELGATVTLPVSNSNEVKAGIYNVTISGLPIYPGIGADPNKNYNATTNDVYSIYNNLVMFAFSGNANVPVKISIGTDIAYSNLNLKVSGTDSSAYLPIGFSCNAGNYSNNVFTLKETFSMGTPGATGGNTTAANRAERIAYNFSTKFGLTQDENYVYEEFRASSSINFTVDNNSDTTDKSGGIVNAFSEGIYWTFYNNATNDTKDTWIVDNNPNGSISITYTVKVEQLENNPS